jgi:hypothetical protein
MLSPLLRIPSDRTSDHAYVTVTHNGDVGLYGIRQLLCVLHVLCTQITDWHIASSPLCSTKQMAHIGRQSDGDLCSTIGHLHAQLYCCKCRCKDHMGPQFDPMVLHTTPPCLLQQAA